MKEDIIYFTRNLQSPCSKAVNKRTDVKIVNPEEDYSEALANAKAAILDADDELRPELVKALLKEKLPFALCGLAGETPDSLKRLCAAAKRRHIQVCWLGSWRYEWAMARLKETITSGVLGTIQQYKLTKPAGLGIFERLRDDDLLNWLASYGNDAATAHEEMEGVGYRLTATGSRGSATATVLEDGQNEFAIALCDETPRVVCQPSAPLEAEIGYLLFAIRTGRPWSMLGRIPN
ncbi:MAG: hypothetical protein MJ202_10785 [Lentisphaeria bacterium]|nr:hypothetical protein [Lentisphaeria bacterium]